MSCIPGADKAFQNLMNWSSRDDWREPRQQIFDAHIATILDRFDLDDDELAEFLGDENYTALLNFAIEDFVAGRFGDEDRNIIDDYLKRRGWRESVPGKHYLRALRDAWPSLYEVVEVNPGRNLVVKDLIDGGPTLTLDDKLASSAATPGDRIATRVVTVNKKRYLSDVVLTFSRQGAEEVLVELAESKSAIGEGSEAEAERAAADEDSGEDKRRKFLLFARPCILTLAWVEDVVDGTTFSPFEASEPDGGEFGLIQVRFPLRGDLDEIEDRLDECFELDRDSLEDLSWTWVPCEEDDDDDDDEGVLTAEEWEQADRILEADLDGEDDLADEAWEDEAAWEPGERLPLANIVLEDGTLYLNVNFEQLAERGRDMLAKLLDDLVGPPVIDTVSLEQLLAKAERRLH